MLLPIPMLISIPIRLKLVNRREKTIGLLIRYLIVVAYWTILGYTISSYNSDSFIEVESLGKSRATTPVKIRDLSEITNKGIIATNVIIFLYFIFSLSYQYSISSPVSCFSRHAQNFQIGVEPLRPQRASFGAMSSREPEEEPGEMGDEGH